MPEGPLWKLPKQACLLKRKVPAIGQVSGAYRGYSGELSDIFPHYQSTFALWEVGRVKQLIGLPMG